ncbi:alpha/beta hydrolase, partial [Enterococcus gallinarum]
MDTIHYKEFGSGKLIYFIHGNSLNLESMIEFYEPFFETNQSFRRIYLDIPGMGDSYLKPSINNSDDILEETYSFILDHSNNKNFSLCGHSYGGYLC